MRDPLKRSGIAQKMRQEIQEVIAELEKLRKPRRRVDAA